MNDASEMMTNNPCRLNYLTSVLALNNMGVSLLEKRRHDDAKLTLRDAVSLLLRSVREEEQDRVGGIRRQGEARADAADSEAASTMLREANRRVSSSAQGPSPRGDGGHRAHSVELRSVAVSSPSLEGTASSASVVVVGATPGDQDLPEHQQIQRRELHYLFRFDDAGYYNGDSSSMMFRREVVDLAVAATLHNLAVCYYLLGGPALCTSAIKFGTMAHSILQMRMSSLSGEPHRASAACCFRDNVEDSDYISPLEGCDRDQLISQLVCAEVLVLVTLIPLLEENYRTQVPAATAHVSDQRTAGGSGAHAEADSIGDNDYHRAEVVDDLLVEMASLQAWIRLLEGPLSEEFGVHTRCTAPAA